MSDLHLLTYLNDHLAGSITGIELAKRCLGNNKNSDLGGFIETLVPLFEKERTKLREMISSLGGHESPLKMFGGWAFEKVTRLKPNNSLLRYSDLARLIELEALLAGMQAQMGMWTALEAGRSDDPRIGSVDFAAMRLEIAAAFSELARHHLEASNKALGPDKGKLREEEKA